MTDPAEVRRLAEAARNTMAAKEAAWDKTVAVTDVADREVTWAEYVEARDAADVACRKWDAAGGKHDPNMPWGIGDGVEDS